MYRPACAKKILQLIDWNSLVLWPSQIQNADRKAQN